MQLSSVYLYEKIKEKYEITERGTLSGSDGYLRPFLCYEKKETFRHGHVYVVQRYDKEWESAVLTAENILWVFCGREEIDAASEELQQIPYIHIALDSLEEIAEFMNDVQEIFDAADEWERKIHNLMLEHAGMDRLLQVTSEFLQNPMTVTGLDFTFVAEAGSEYLPPRARLYTDDGLNMEYVNALLQNETYRDMADTHEYVMFPAYISGCRSMNRNLFVDGKATHRLVLTECRSEITLRVICVLDILVEKLEYLLAHEAEEEDPDRDMEQIFVRIQSVIFCGQFIHAILFCSLLLRLLSFDFSLRIFLAQAGQYLDAPEPGTYSTPHTVQFLAGIAAHRFVGMICNSSTKPMNL